MKVPSSEKSFEAVLGVIFKLLNSPLEQFDSILEENGVALDKDEREQLFNNVKVLQEEQAKC